MRLSKNASLLSGVFLISLSNLMLELMLTRICSVVMYYHFAFLTVSLALLGISVSGICVYLFARRFSPERATLQASLFSLLFALSILLALAATLLLPFKVEASLGSVLAAILSINYSFNVTLAGGLAAYLIALLTVAASPDLKLGPQFPSAEF
jgi:hypothetical protein